MACLEVDDVDPLAHAGWSVMVVGQLEEISEAADADTADRLPLRAWGRAEARHVLTLPLDMVTGRRISRPAS